MRQKVLWTTVIVSKDKPPPPNALRTAYIGMMGRFDATSTMT